MYQNSVRSNRFSQDLDLFSAGLTRTHRILYPLSWKPELPIWANSMNSLVFDWLDQQGLLSNAAAQSQVKDQRADLYGGYSFGWADFDKCLTITKFLVLWILFDDVVTESDGGYWDRYGLSIQDYTEAMRGGPLSPRADPFLRAWWKLSQEFKSTMSQRWMERWASLFAGWLASTVRERETYELLRSNEKLPDLDTYVSIRSLTIGVLPTLPLIEFAGGFELPDKVLGCASLNILNGIGCRLKLLANDIFGLEKDLVSGWPNAVTVIARQHGQNLIDALEYTVRIHNEHLAVFMEVERSLPVFGPEEQPLIDRYLEGFHVGIRGLAEFEMRAERYQWKKQLAESSFRHRVTISSFSDE